MSIIIYADESGTHDLTGKLKGSEAAVISGYAAWKANWGRFVKEWQNTLKLNGVLDFHFSDLEVNRRHPDKKSYYTGWSERRKSAFVKKLAKIAVHHTLFPVGGNVATKLIHEEKCLAGQQDSVPLCKLL